MFTSKLSSTSALDDAPESVSSSFIVVGSDDFSLSEEDLKTKLSGGNGLRDTNLSFSLALMFSFLAILLELEVSPSSSPSLSSLSFCFQPPGVSNYSILFLWLGIGITKHLAF